eukprot:scaffold7794_cov34-Phaeocystis_antarctica.AAC.2
MCTTDPPRGAVPVARARLDVDQLTTCELCKYSYCHLVKELLEDARTLSHPLGRTAAFAQHPQLANEMVARVPLTQHRAHRRRDVHRRCYHWCSGGAQARCCSGGAAGAVL